MANLSDLYRQLTALVDQVDDALTEMSEAFSDAADAAAKAGDELGCKKFDDADFAALNFRSDLRSSAAMRKIAAAVSRATKQPAA
mgnify:CR=1 FL=1